MVIIKKTHNYLKYFQKIIKNNLKKEYHALILGKIKKNLKTKLSQKILNKYNKKINIKKTDTINQCKIIKIYKTHSLIKIFLLTGKIHQIRIHFTHIGHPIKNDKKYFQKTLKNLTLQAKSIKFKCPINKQKYNIKANYTNTLKYFINTQYRKKLK